MKILQCINALTWGGAQAFLIDLCRFLMQRGHFVRVAAFRNGPIAEHLKSIGVQVDILDEICFDLLGALRLRRIVFEWNPDLIHSHLGKATFWIRLMKGGFFLKNRRLPVVVTSVHGFEAGGFHHLEKHMACRSDHLIFPSRFMADWYQNNLRSVPAHRYSIISPGAAIWQEPTNIERHRKQQGKPIVIGALARLHPVKGIDVMLLAAAKLRALGLNFRIMIGGEGREFDYLQNLAAQLNLADTVIWVGAVNNRIAFLNSIDVLVAPSREEAFGISICEAMERGIAVIASAVGGIPEIIRDGIDGCLVPPNDPAKLAEALQALLIDHDLRRKLAIAGRQRIVERFSRDEALKRHLEVYTNLVLNAKRRIHLAISSGELGGGERVALSLVEGLKARGWHITFTCGGPLLKKQLCELKAIGNIASMRAGGFFYAARLMADLVRYQPMIVNAHLNKAALSASLIEMIARLFFPRPLSAAHQSQLCLMQSELSRRLQLSQLPQCLQWLWEGKWLRWTRCFLHPRPARPIIAHVHGLNRAVYYKYCDHLVAVSKAVYEHMLSQGISKERMTLISNCIPCRQIAQYAAERQPGPPWTIAIIAKLHKNKGHQWALQAIEGAINQLPPFKLWIFGDGPERKALTDRFTKGPLASQVTFWGFQSNLEPFYRDIHLVLLPSLAEGIPLSLLEAMRWSIPIVATRVGGIPEIVRNGVNGLLVDLDHAEGLIAALKQILDPDNWYKFANEAANCFMTYNNFDKMLDRFEELLLSVLFDHPFNPAEEKHSGAHNLQMASDN